LKGTQTSNGPHTFSLVLGVNPGHAYLLEQADLAKRVEGRCEKVDDNTVIHRFLYVNDLSLNKTHANLEVHLLE